MDVCSDNTTDLVQMFTYANYNEGNVSLDMEDPVILASSYMLYKIGKFAFYVVDFNIFFRIIPFSEMGHTIFL